MVDQWGYMRIILSSLLFSLVSAIPINVDLQSNWRDLPFRLHLIESLAAENSSIYFPLVDQLVWSEELDGRLTDHQLSETIIRHCQENELLSVDSVKFAKFSMAIKRYSALVQAQYQYFDTVILPKFQSSLPSDCENVFYYNGKPSCDAGKIYALETEAVSDVEILPTDKIYSTNPEAPFGILYGDLESESFGEFHKALLASAVDGKVQYVLRYKPSIKLPEKKETLAGYGVELYVKRTDYLVIDDRNEGDSDEETKLESLAEDTKPEESRKTISLKPNLDASAIDKNKLQMLGNRAAGYVLSQENPFEALKDLSLNFPKFAASLAELELFSAIWSEQRKNALNGNFQIGQNLILINGAHVGHPSQDIYSLMKHVDNERKLVQKLASRAGIDSHTAAKLIAENLLKDSDISEDRYDFRNEGLIWLNDLTEDPRFAKWTDKLSGYLEPSMGPFPSVKKNAFSFVFVIDLSRIDHSQILNNVLSLYVRGLPVQFGVIPMLGTSKQNDKLARASFYLKSKDIDPQRFLFSLLAHQDVEQAFKKSAGIALEKADLNSEGVNEIFAATKGWLTDLDIDLTNPTVFADGVLLDAASPSWLNSASIILDKDTAQIKDWITQNVVDEDTILRDQFLAAAAKTRNRLIKPADPAEAEYRDTFALHELSKTTRFEKLEKTTDEKENKIFTTVWILADLGKTAVREKVEKFTDAFESIQKNVKLTVIPVAADGTRDEVAESEFLSTRLKDNYDSSATGKFVTEKLRNSGFLSGTVPDITIIVNGRIVHFNADRSFTESNFIQLIDYETAKRIEPLITACKNRVILNNFDETDLFISLYSTVNYGADDAVALTRSAYQRISTASWLGNHTTMHIGEDEDKASLDVVSIIDPLSESGQVYITLVESLSKLPGVSVTIFLSPNIVRDGNLPLKRFYRAAYPDQPRFNEENGKVEEEHVIFNDIPTDTLLNMDIHVPSAWVVTPSNSVYDLENIILDSVNEKSLRATYQLDYILLEGHAKEKEGPYPPVGMALELRDAETVSLTDTSVMSNLGYLQLRANPGMWYLDIEKGRSSEVFALESTGLKPDHLSQSNAVWITEMNGITLYPTFKRNKGMETANVLEPSSGGLLGRLNNAFRKSALANTSADINIFTVASGHLYERFLSIMTASVMKHTDHTVKFWLIENFLSPSFKLFLPHLAEKYGFEYELITYKWPSWLRGQTEKQRTIWGYKILFLDVLFPQTLKKVIFVDADQIVRTDLYELVQLDLHGAPYGYTPMGDSRDEMEGFRFWKQGYWKNFLKGKPYHISALYVIDLVKFREMAAGDILRKHYQALSQDPESLSNLDQDLPNHLQDIIPIYSLPQDWLWCETWCSDESLKTAKTIDLCNNPLTKEPKLDRARRQIPEWTEYDNEIASLVEQVKYETEKIEQLEKDEEQMKTEEEENNLHEHDEL